MRVVRSPLVSKWSVRNASSGSKLLTSARVLHSSYDCRASAFSSADVAVTKLSSKIATETCSRVQFTMTMNETQKTTTVESITPLSWNGGRSGSHDSPAVTRNIVMIARSKEPKCSDDRSPKKLIPTIAYMEVTMSMMRKALRTGMMEVVSAVMISRSRRIRPKSLNTRSARMTRKIAPFGIFVMKNDISEMLTATRSNTLHPSVKNSLAQCA
mmetsp:Transcript_16401/g.39344  ORF Transcript_16401/g.39344 Transcript_16401/m.39344 type:complete len:213 (+) Transcript_16401:273-911(+)